MEHNNAQEIQILEQNLHNLLLQKQALEMGLAEINTSIKELESSGEEVFKIIGQLMLKGDKANIKKELLDKKKIVSSQIEILGKQEKSLLRQMEKTRKEKSV